MNLRRSSESKHGVKKAPTKIAIYRDHTSNAIDERPIAALGIRSWPDFSDWSNHRGSRTDTLRFSFSRSRMIYSIL